MASTREMRLRIRSITNLAQVTRALETVSASKVRKAVLANEQTQAYAERAWKILVHLADQSSSQNMHPLLMDHKEVKRGLVILITSDRGLAGAYNVNIVRQALMKVQELDYPVDFVTVGRKGREMMLRRKKNVIADFQGFPGNPSYTECSSIGFLAVDDFIKGTYDEVFVAFTQFKSMLKQEPVIRRLLPIHPDSIELDYNGVKRTHKSNLIFSYEPGPEELLDQIIPRFTALQVYQAILSALASEHAARRLAMSNATESANELVSVLKLAYNKVRQAGITSDMLDISGGAEALSQASNNKG